MMNSRKPGILFRQHRHNPNEGLGKLAARLKACFEICAIDDGQAKPAGRHGMLLARAIVIIGHLQTLHMGQSEDFVLHFG